MQTTDSIAYAQLPLGTIRLLRFHDNHQTSNHVGNLEIVALDNTPPYYALSYCWGQDSQSIPLRLEDGIMLINPNLAAAIASLRDLALGDSGEALRVRYIWIDKICIDQNDVLERSAQVGLMGRIYSQAVRTLVWLGFDVGQCPGAWWLVDQIYDVCVKQNPGARSISDISLQLYSRQLHTESGLPDLTHEHWASLSTLLTDPWFTRIWVVQEVVLSRDDPIILHGRLRYSWDRLGWAASWMRRNGFFRLPQFPEALRNVDEMSNIRRSRGRWPLDALLTATSVKFHATDQRDKVYGLLGIAAETSDPLNKPAPLQPDYGLSTEQVYLRTARYLLETNQSLAMIIRTRIPATCPSQAQHANDLIHLPTWMPDWSDSTLFDRDTMKSLSWLAYSKTLEPAELGFPRHCSASAGRPMTLLDSADEKVLRVAGIKFDKISHIFPFNDMSQSSVDFVENYTSISLRILECVAPLLVGKDAIAWIIQYIRTTTAEQYPLSGRSCELILRDGAAYVLELLTKCDALRSRLTFQSGELNVMGLLEHMSLGGNATIYAALARNFCYGRSLVVTSRQILGLASAHTHPGDFVVVLYGGGVPYILRKHESGWQFIGDSYFPGIIKGEAVYAQDMKEEIFHIH